MCFTALLHPSRKQQASNTWALLQKHEELMWGFVLCSLLKGPFGFQSTAEQRMGVLRKLSTLTMGFLLSVTIVRTAPCFSKRLLLPQRCFADANTPHVHTPLALVKSSCGRCHRFSLARLSSTTSSLATPRFALFHIIYGCAEQSSFTRGTSDSLPAAFNTTGHFYLLPSCF